MAPADKLNSFPAQVAIDAWYTSKGLPSSAGKLYDFDALSGRARPYVVVDFGAFTVIETCTGHSASKYDLTRIMELDFQFRVHGTSKENSAERADAIQQVFENACLDLPDNWDQINLLPQQDFAVDEDRQSGKEWQWVLPYVLQVGIGGKTNQS